MESRYDKVTPEQIAAKCTHLTPEQQDNLVKLFSKFEMLLDGQLWNFTDEQIHLDVGPTVSPNRLHAYAVLHRQQELFKRELN